MTTSTTADARIAHGRGQHLAETAAERAALAAECAFCARAWNHDGSFKMDRMVAPTDAPAFNSYGTHSGRVASRPTKTVYPPSEAQVKFVESLWEQKDTSAIVPEVKAAALADKRLTSALIDTLKALPRKQAPQAAAGAEVTEDGIYFNAETNEVYKVQIAKQGSGRLYAKLLTQPEGEARGEKWTFEYVAGLIKKIRPEWKMSREQAAEFGRLYGVCCKCGAALTDEDSIARGIGPICAQGF